MGYLKAAKSFNVPHQTVSRLVEKRDFSPRKLVDRPDDGDSKDL
jgi:hypothetical protein